jgi:hypothetical protein
MNSSLNKLSAPALRTILARETRKFAMGLEYSSTLKDLRKIRTYIKALENLIVIKEENEKQTLNVENLPKLDFKSVNGYR